MGEYIQGKDGKFAGSLGSGKSDIPRPADTPAGHAPVSEPDADHSVSDAYAAYQQMDAGALPPDASGEVLPTDAVEDVPSAAYMPYEQQLAAYQEYLDGCFDRGAAMTIVDTDPCPLCQKGGSVTLASADYERGLQMRRDGHMIQDCLPMLTPGMREQILTGMHPQCWDQMFGDPDALD